MRFVMTLLALIFAASQAEAQSIVGRWSGTATRGGDARPITLEIAETPQGLSAFYDAPSLGLAHIPLPGFNFDVGDGKIVAGHALQARVENGRIVGRFLPLLVHGDPGRIDLVRNAVPVRSWRSQEREVSFTSNGALLRGTLVTPLRGPGRFAALVSLHGSGCSTRWLALDRARRFAQVGYAMLIYDKPGCGASGGNWTMESLDDEAGDAIAAADFLAAQPEVDPARIGLWGHSHAGWIISRAIASSNRFAFAIVLAGGGSTPAEVETYGYLGKMTRAGAKPAQLEAGATWVRAYLDYVRTGEKYQEVTDAIARGREQGWGKLLDVDTVYPLPSQWAKWQWVATYDPATDIRAIRVPILAMFAADDEQTPSVQSLERWRSAMPTRLLETRFFARGDHHFLAESVSGGWPSLVSGYYKAQFNWLAGVVRLKRK
jgi:hypothetical protein